MLTTNKIPAHILFVPFTAWGHIRPACQLALRLIECNESITITILTVPHLLNRAKSEIEAHIPSGTQINYSSRIRVLTAFESSDNDVVKLAGPFMGTYVVAYKCLYEEKPITCATTGVTYDGVSTPAVVILDFFWSPLISATRALSGKSVPIFNWATGSPHATIRMWAPKSLGGRASLFSQVVEEGERTGEDPDELGGKYYRQTTGEVIRIPGLPPMFDHEFFPQELSLPFVVMKSGLEVFQQCDGVLLSASYAVDGGGIEGVKTWMSETKRPVYSLGPLLPASYWDPVVQSSRKAPDVVSFLSNALEKQGEHSVVLVSFGTYFWPPKQEYVEELVTAFIEKGVPFILVHNSPMATISEAFLGRIETSGIGMCSKWVPQQYVLSHPAIGWFLTHGGQGGVTEALGSGVPLICWPVDGDQPATSANASINLHVAFELIEVRTGPGLQGVYRLDGRKPCGTRETMGREIREVVDAARGEVGREMRKTAQKIRAQMRESWNETGVAKQDLHAFVDRVAKWKDLA